MTRLNAVIRETWWGVRVIAKWLDEATGLSFIFWRCWRNPDADLWTKAFWQGVVGALFWFTWFGVLLWFAAWSLHRNGWLG